MKALLCIVLSLWMAACSYGQGSGDGGIPDGQEDAGGGEPDRFPDGVTLRIPQGFELCDHNGGWTLLARQYLKTRVALREGEVSLPLDQEEYEIDIIERVRVSPDGAEVSAVGPGRFHFFRESWGGGYPDYCVYSYTQPFSLDAETLEIHFGFWLECEEGATWDITDNLWPGVYPCDGLDGYEAGSVVAMVQNGDRIEFDYRFHEGCAKWITAGLCPAFYGDPTMGKFIRGQDQRVVTEYYRLALLCGHHMGPRYFLMVFDQPLEGIHGVVLDHNGIETAEVDYLDADLSTILTETVDDIQYQ